MHTPAAALIIGSNCRHYVTINNLLVVSLVTVVCTGAYTTGSMQCAWQTHEMIVDYVDLMTLASKAAPPHIIKCEPLLGELGPKIGILGYQDP